MDYIDKFKSWVDESEEQLTANVPDFSQRRAPREPFMAIVMTLSQYPPPTTLSQENIARLEKHFLLEHLVDGVKRSKNYLEICYVIRQAFEWNRTYSGSKPWWFDFSDCYDNFWLNAIRIVLEYKLAVSSTEQIMEFRDLTWIERVRKIGDATFYLRQKGYSLTLVNGRVGTESELQRIAEDIDSEIKRLGGLIVARKVFDELDKIQNVSRNPLINNSHPIPVSKYFGLPLPVAYLLNLSVKHIIETSLDYGNESSKINDLFEMVAAFGAIYDVYSYERRDPIETDPNRISDFLIEKALFQKMFLLDQFPLDEIPNFLRSIFSCVKEAAVSKLGWSPDDAALFVEDLLACLPQDERCVWIDMRQMRYKTRLNDRSVFDKIFEFSSHSPNELNDSIVLPHDHRYNFWCKPLINMGSGRYLFFNHSWSSLNFYEAVAAEIKKTVADIHDNMGTPLEKLVLCKLRSRGLSCFSTESSGGKDFPQCDAIVSTPKSLFIMEIKKKGLTKAGESGDDLFITSDLCQSLINSQSQLVERALRLLEGETVRVSDADIMHDISLDGRSIHLITLTLRSFGPFQDKRTLSQLTSILAGSTFSSSPETATTEEANNLKKATKYAKKLLLNEKELKGTLQRIGESPFLRSRWFLDLGQLLILLDNIDSHDDFERAFEEALYC